MLGKAEKSSIPSVSRLVGGVTVRGPRPGWVEASATASSATNSAFWVGTRWWTGRTFRVKPRAFSKSGLPGWPRVKATMRSGGITVSSAPRTPRES